MLAMAKNKPNTNKSQFYIIYEKQPQLDNVDTVIGKVIYGMDTLQAMENTPVNEKYRPLKDIVITGHAVRDDIHGFSTEEGGKKQVETMSGME